MRISHIWAPVQHPQRGHTHTHTQKCLHTYIINWPLPTPAESCRVWCEMPNTSWNHAIKSPSAAAEWWRQTGPGPHYSGHWSLSASECIFEYPRANIDFFFYFTFALHSNNVDIELLSKADLKQLQEAAWCDQYWAHWQWQWNKIYLYRHLTLAK